MKNWEIRIIDKGYEPDRSVYIYRLLYDGKIMTLDGKVYGAGDAVPDEPVMKLSPEQLQAFADELNAVGYKPQKGFIEGKLEATEKHLEDMRSLILKGQKPKN